MTEQPTAGTEPSTTRQSGRVSRTLGELRLRPRLFLPFLIVAFVSTAVGWLHRRDPLPTVARQTLADGNIRLEYFGYPAGTRGTTLSLESLLGLRPPFLAWGVSAYTLVIVAHAVAATVVIVRVLGVEPDWPTVVSVCLYVAAIDLLHRAVGSVELLQDMGIIFGLPVLVAWLYLLVRLFAVPGLIVTERAVTDAVYRSWRLTQGQGWRVLGVIVALGLGNALFATFEVVGPALSTVVVGTFHAVYLGAFVEKAY